MRGDGSMGGRWRPGTVTVGLLGALVGLALLLGAFAGVAAAAPRPVEDKTPESSRPPAGPASKVPADSAPKGEAIPKTLPELRLPGQSAPSTSAPSAEEIYRTLLRSPAGRSAADTMGNGVYAAARRAFLTGSFEECAARVQEFTRIYTRNLNMNDALEMMLLARNYQDFDGEPLRAYARALAFRATGHADSAGQTATAALARWPGAKVRYHLQYELAELAKDRGDHAAAVTYALAVADSSSRSRLAPAALKLAGDETIAMGRGPDEALRYYQNLLERYPDSPLASTVRAQVLEMRRRHQL